MKEEEMTTVVFVEDMKGNSKTEDWEYGDDEN